MTVLLALIMAVASLPAAVMGEPVTVIATSYSCDNHPDNRMFPCGQTRWGYDPLQPGAACPTTWAHTAIYVPKRGVMTCDDSGRYNSLYGLPHVDIRVSSHDEAVQWGIREIVIYRWELPRWGQERKGHMATPIQLAVEMALYDERNAIVEWLTSKRDSFQAAANSKRELGVMPEWVAIDSHIADAYQTTIDYVNGRREG